jgi:site-specific DNA-methyltransferase (adenine-specific)
MKDRYQIIQGDCRESLKTLTENSVNCCVTSPPYFGLRSYGGGEDEIGIEDRVEDYIQSLVDVFREVRRVLRPDGTLWLNLGDSYMAQKNVVPPPQTIGGQRDMPTGIPGNRREQKGLKHKDLIGIPWRVALALQADGWWLRQDIIWHKPNPMPESVEDRCTRAHEYIFMLSKKSHYYYDHEAIKEAAVTAPTSRDKEGEGYQADYPHGPRFSKGERVWGADGKKNKRSVWTVNTKGYKGAHFAVYPKQLVLPCILAGCPEDGTVLDPFNGSGTTGVVALQNNRRYIGLELNPEYVKLAEARIAEEVSPLTSLFE